MDDMHSGVHRPVGGSQGGEAVKVLLPLSTRSACVAAHKDSLQQVYRNDQGNAGQMAGIAWRLVSLNREYQISW